MRSCFLQRDLAKNINYFKQTNRNENWTALMDETDYTKIRVLYQCRPDIGIFSNLQLLFQLKFHENKPPDLNALTPNGRFPVNEAICLEQIWNTNNLDTLIEKIMYIFLDKSIVLFGNTVLYFNECAIKKFSETSHSWNKMHYTDIYNQYNEQTENTICKIFGKIVNFKEKMEED